MQILPLVARSLLGSLVFAATAAGQEKGPFAHFERRTPTTFPQKYVKPAVEADNDTLGYGEPASAAAVACSIPITGGTNSDSVRVVLKDVFDAPESRSTFAPGELRTIESAYTVSVKVNSSSTISHDGTEYELYRHDDPLGTATKVVLDSAGEFELTIPANATRWSQARNVEVRFLRDPCNDDEPLESLILDIVGAESLSGEPLLFPGANGKATWLVEDNRAPDECDVAVQVVGSGSFGFDTTGANPSSSPVPAWSCAAGGADVWFKWVSDFDGMVTIDTCTGTGFDTVVEVYDGPCGSLASIACNDDSTTCPPQSEITFTATFGTAYYVRVGGVGGATGAGTLTVTELSPPLPPPANAKFVNLGHATPVTKTNHDQVSTKVIKEFTTPNVDHFGIRYYSNNAPFMGSVLGQEIFLSGIRIWGAVTSDAVHGVDFEFYTDSALQTPVTWCPSSNAFYMDTPALPALGAALWVELIGDFNDIGDLSFCILRVTDTSILCGDTPVPQATRVPGWNFEGQWIVLN